MANQNNRLASLAETAIEETKKQKAEEKRKRMAHIQLAKEAEMNKNIYK